VPHEEHEGGVSRADLLRIALVGAAVAGAWLAPVGAFWSVRAG